MRRALERFLSVAAGGLATVLTIHESSGGSPDPRLGTPSLRERVRQIQLVPTAELKRQCDGGDTDGCYGLGSCYWHGACGVAEDRKRAGELFREACDGGSAAGCFESGMCYRNGDCGVSADPQKAGVLFRKSCEGACQEGCFRLGLCYWDADCGVAPDRREAQALFEKACDGGEANACSKLATCYKEGDCGSSEERSRASALAEKACLGGQVAGCVTLAQCYYEGDCGLSRNLPRAGALYRKACDGENMRGCSSLGVCYANGQCGFERDPSLAEQLFRRACDAGEPSGCSSWEECHARGDCRASHGPERYGASGKGIRAAGDVILGLDYARIQPANGVPAENLFAAGLHARLSGFPPGVPFSVALDAAVGGGPGLYYDLTALVGPGAWLGRYVGLAALGGIGSDSVANDIVPFALKTPARLWTGLNLGPVVRVEIDAGANWLFDTDERRKSGSHILRGYADEFQAGSRVFFGRRSSADAQDPNVLLGVGFTLREALGTQMLLFSVGVAVATDPYLTRRASGPI